VLEIKENANGCARNETWWGPWRAESGARRKEGAWEERVNDCCLTPTQQFFSYIMARTS
jgi:hypothetical protein